MADENLFKDTLKGVRDCTTALENLFNGVASLSPEELQHAKALIEESMEMLQLVGEQVGGGAEDLNNEGAVDEINHHLDDVMDAANEEAEMIR